MHKPILIPLLSCGILAAFSFSSLHAGTAGTSGKNASSPVAPAGTCGHDCGPWDTSIYTGLSLLDGTVDSIALNAGFRAIGTWTNKEALLSADYLYGEADKATNTNAFRARAQLNQLLTDRAYIGLAGGFLYDEMAAVDYRVSISPTFGYYLVKSASTKLALELGGSYFWEKQGGLSRDFVSLRVAERFEHTFENGSTIYQMLEYLPEVEEFGNFLLAAEVGLEVPITGSLKWRLAARDVYDSTPGKGLDKNDLMILTGLTYNFGAPASPLKCKICRAQAAAKPAPLPAKDTWITTGSLGFSLTRGNSENLLVSVGIDTVKYTDADETRLRIGGTYGEVGNSVNAQSFFTNVQYNRALADPFYAGFGVDFLHNQIADLDYRATPAALLGAYLIKTDATKLAIEAGPAWTFQKQGGVDDSFFSILARERFETVLPKCGSKLFESIGVLLNAQDTDKYIVTAEVGMDMKIVGKVNFRVAVQDIYDSQPAKDAASNELRLISGISINF